jgi:hypothetical protein
MLILYPPGVANPFRNEYAEISFLAHGHSGVSSDRRWLYHGRYPLFQVVSTSVGPILPGARLGIPYDRRWRLVCMHVVVHTLFGSFTCLKSFDVRNDLYEGVEES